MSLFGKPNIEKYRKEGRIRKLVNLLNNKDHQIKKDSLEALNDITKDETLTRHRKEKWILNYHYKEALQAINRLDSEQKTSIEELIEKLVQEKESLERENEEKMHVLEGLKNQFLECYNRKAITEKNFFSDLLKIIGENKKFLHTVKLVNTKSMGDFNGVIVTNDEIVYFELNVFHKLDSIRFDETKEFSIKENIFGKKMTILGQSGRFISLHVDDNNEEMIAFIKSKVNNL